MDRWTGWDRGSGQEWKQNGMKGPPLFGGATVEHGKPSWNLSLQRVCLCNLPEFRGSYSDM